MKQEKKKDPKRIQSEKKLIDRQGRLFGLISIIDVVVIFAVIVLCFGVYLKTNVLSVTGSNTEEVTISFTFEARIVEDYIQEALQVGDYVYDKDHATGGAIGVITNIEVLEPRAIGELSDGTLNYITSNRGCNLLVTVEGTGAILDGVYTFNRVYRIGLNAARNFQTKYATLTGFVIDIHAS